ncbi:MAG: thiamine pyrophosphate-binding protein [Verrucomicrobiota bacterium]|nr:thiamine pyrophosphate-binding protein [Verrucomicrobiota bacterium]
MTTPQTTTLGAYLATRLSQAGMKDFFGVPGDFNLVLLDELLKEPDLRMIGCCNELNAGYAADGYARVRGLSMVVVTYMVGGLSVMNATAGSYSDDLPVLVVSGGPNTNDAPAHHLLHHTIGEYELYQASKCFEPVVRKTFVIRHLDDATRMIDEAITLCLRDKKPVYLEIPCNIANAKVPAPGPLVFPPSAVTTDPASLQAAVDAAVSHLENTVKPVLIAGVKLASQEAMTSFAKLADALACAVAVMPNAKGLFPESHSGFIGTYWGEVSSPDCAEVVESSDCQIFAGPIFNDYTTTGWTTLINHKKSIQIGPDFVIVAGAPFHNVRLNDFLAALASRTPKKEASLQAYTRLHEAPPATTLAATDAPLSLRELRHHVQDLINGDSHLVIETGDSWFNGQKLILPDGAGYHFQMQYGSIGWATGATLGVAIGAGPAKRVVSLIGDGSFQLTAQEISTMIRYQTNPIIFLLNNRGYTIEVEIHDGPYNNIKNWNYAGLVDVFNAGEGNGLGLKAATSAELTTAIERAKKHDGLVLIECALDRDDCTKELLEWGSRVASANARPPV